MKKNDKYIRAIFCLPIVIFSVLLIALPLLYIFFISFLQSDSYGGMNYIITLENYRELFSYVYLKIFLQSFLVAIIATGICILIAYPFCLAVSHKSKRTQKIIMTFIMVPFLTNSLIRMYGWIILLRKNGVINTLLMNTGIINNPLDLMYNYSGIIIGMVYTLLPFMLLPLHSVISTVDHRLLEAASDLGASKWQTFKNVIFPHSVPGLFNGAIMVFTPAIGYFFVTDILGGGKIMILGNLIKNQFLTSRNWPLGSAIAVFLIALTFLFIVIYKKLGNKMEDLGV